MVTYSTRAHGVVGVCPHLISTINLASLHYNLSEGLSGNIFFPIPTPVIVNGARAKLERVFVLYALDPVAIFGPVDVFDGQDAGAHDPISTGQFFFEVSIADRVTCTGVEGLNDLVPNVTQFELIGEQPDVYFGLTPAVGVHCKPMVVNAPTNRSDARQSEGSLQSDKSRLATSVSHPSGPTLRLDEIG